MTVRVDPGGQVPPFTPADAGEPVAARFLRVADAVPERPALIGDDVNVSYRALLGAVQRVREMVEADGADGDPVALMLPPGPLMVAALFGTLMTRRVAMPIDMDQPPERINETLDGVGFHSALTGDGSTALARHRGMVVKELGMDLFDGAKVAVPAPAIDPGAPAFFGATSGTSGTPKAIVHSNRTIMHTQYAYARCTAVSPDDRVAALHRRYLDVLGALLNGAALGIFHAVSMGLGGLADWLDRHRVTVLPLVPTALRGLDRHAAAGRRFDSVRLIRSSGEPLLAADIECMQRRFGAATRLVNWMASNETPLAIAELDLGGFDPARGLPAGTPVEGVRLCVLDDDLHPAAAGTLGEVAVGGPHLFLGYREHGALTEPDRVELAGEKLFLTGDLGRLDQGGRLTLVARKDGFLKCNAYRIDPLEVEQALQSLPAVRTAALCVWPDPAAGDRLAVFMTVTDDFGYRVGELRAFLASRVPAYMVPRFFVLADELPCGDTGKTLRRALPVLTDAGAADFHRWAGPAAAQPQTGR